MLRLNLTFKGDALNTFISPCTENNIHSYFWIFCAIIINPDLQQKSKQLVQERLPSVITAHSIYSSAVS